ncbi:MAG: hypothetical protein KIT14_03070 [bacterium]|nr:hypothetical protein [bacterium]
METRSPGLGNPDWTDNWTTGGHVLHMEIMSGRYVWLAQGACSVEQYERLALPEGFMRTGIGRAVADAAYFARSPDADADGPVETMEVDGVRFARVARPGRPEPPREGLFVLPVHKHHRVLYRAGRTIEVLRADDGGDYLPLVAGARMAASDMDGRPRVLPDGWVVREVALDADLVVDLPCPTRVTFFTSGDSFQGPVRLGR